MLQRRCEHAFDQEEEDSTERKSTTGTNQSGPLPPSARYNDARSLVGKGLIERDPTTPASVLSNEDEATVHAKVHSAGPSHMKARRRSDIPRFVGDLNPEATLLGRATVPAGGRCSDQDEVGVWIESENETQDTAWSGDPKATITDSRPTILTGPFKKDHENALWDYLNALGAFDGPPPSDQDALVETYFSEVHPILPMLDETAFRQAYMDGSESKSLVQALCLVASKHHSAATHLRFSDGSPALSPRDFAKSLYTGLNAAVSLKTEPDKLVLIRVLALLSLHSEGPDGAEMASLHLAQAIHHAQTLGLHLRRSQMTSENKKFQDLFWCLWSLDKLQAGINGRPVIIADRDVGVKSLSSPDQRQNAFQVWVRIAVLMNKVINLYRPNADSNTPGWDDVFPTFEDVVGTHDGTDLKASHLGTSFFTLLI